MTRPRLCRTCHKDATFVERTVLPAVVVKRDGTIQRTQRVEGVYYCDEHTGMSA